MAERQTSDTGWSIRTPSLALEFRWSVDRWIHVIEVGPPERRIEVARSLESDPSRDDPGRVVSPIYQQIEFQKEENRLGALLLGQAGRHHFSAAFAVWERAGAVGIEVDVADRCRAEVHSLACTYQVSLPVGTLSDAGQTYAIWQPDDQPGGALRFEGHESTRVVVSEGARGGLRAQVSARIDPRARTHRCVYRWTWSQAAP